jgi:hypothetical protein
VIAVVFTRMRNSSSTPDPTHISPRHRHRDKSNPSESIKETRPPPRHQHPLPPHHSHTPTTVLVPCAARVPTIVVQPIDMKDTPRHHRLDPVLVLAP